MQEYRRYRLTLRHDAGTVRITTVSTSADRAIALICAAEHAPARAVVKVEDLGVIA
jgi:hypothetical protein